MVADDGLIYLDGNSLGRLPRRTRDRLRAIIEDEWGSGLIRSWSTWVGEPVACRRPARRGAARRRRRARCWSRDNTTVNLYKLAAAAVDEVRARDPRRIEDRHRQRQLPDRPVRARGARRRARDVARAGRPAGARADHRAVARRRPRRPGRACCRCRSSTTGRPRSPTWPASRRAADAVGAHVVWDLSHAVGAIPIDLDGGRRHARGRLHVQVRQRRTWRAGVPLRPARLAGAAPAAGLGMVRPGRPVRDGPGLRAGRRDPAVRDRHAADARRRGGIGGRRPARRGRDAGAAGEVDRRSPSS